MATIGIPEISKERHITSHSSLKVKDGALKYASRLFGVSTQYTRQKRKVKYSR